MQSSKLIEWFLCVLIGWRLSSYTHITMWRDVENRKIQRERKSTHTLSAASKPKRLYRRSVCNKLIVCLQNRWLQRHCVLCVKGKYCDSISERWSIRFPHFGSILSVHDCRWEVFKSTHGWKLVTVWHLCCCCYCLYRVRYSVLYYAVLCCLCAVQRQQ